MTRFYRDPIRVCNIFNNVFILALDNVALPSAPSSSSKVLDDKVCIAFKFKQIDEKQVEQIFLYFENPSNDQVVMRSSQ